LRVKINSVMAKSVLLELTLPLGGYRGPKPLIVVILEVKSAIGFNLGI